MTSLNQLDMSRLQILSGLDSSRMWDSAWATVQPLCSQLFSQCVFQHFVKEREASPYLPPALGFLHLFFLSQA